MESRARASVELTAIPKPVKGTAGTFLTAEWRHLAMLNYEIDPALLRPLVPRGTELDSLNGQTFITLVGFLFVRTRVLGVPIPLHRDFEEVNLRFYVRRRADDGWRRAVVFIQELVPRAAIAWVARSFYGENYVRAAMSHRIEFDRSSASRPVRVSYSWTHQKQLLRLEACAAGDSSAADAGNLQEFITEHYWGYSRARDGETLEYRVEHPRWNCRSAEGHLEGDFRAQYGASLGASLAAPPHSALLADGSAVRVYRPVRLASI